MPYDPHGQQDTQMLNDQPNLGLMGMVGEYYKFKYTAMPSTWSGSEGVATPFGFSPTWRGFRRLERKVAVAWGRAQQRGASFFGRNVDAFRALKQNWGAWWSAGGGRIGGYESYIERTRTANQIYKKSLDAVKRAEAEVGGRTRAYFNFREQYEKALQPLKTGGFGKVKGADWRTWEKRVTSSRGAMEAARTKLAEMQVKHKLSKETLTRLVGQQGIRTVGKWAIRGAKAVSWIGTALFFADVAGMVAEPIGRAMVQQVNATMERFEERFMPELGGKLNAAYLSYGAATERQRAVQAISKAHINGRSAFGQEAQLMHS